MTGHIAIDCLLATLKEQNRVCQCGCDPDAVEAKRLYNYSSKRTHHCCHCQKPNRPEDLRALNNQFVCRGCYSDYHYELPQMILNVSITMTKEMDVELLSHARFVKKPDLPPECIV